MFSVKIDDLTLWSPVDNKLKIVSPTLSLEVNKVGSFSFKIYPDHMYYGRLVKMKSIISVHQDNRTLFKGRIFSDEIDFHKAKKVEVEGVLGFLNDSIVRPYSFKGSVTDYFTTLIEQHNAQVEEFQRFKVGIVTVEDPNDYITREASNTPKTWDEINDKLIKLLGGYISIRYEADGNYLDYLADYADTSTQKIAFAVNLLDLEQLTKGDSLATCIIPYGAKDEATGKPIDITSVNGGVDFVYDADAVARYGRIFEVKTWDDVTLPSNLLTKARLYLSERIRFLSTLTIKAVDLHLADETIEAFKLGDYVEIDSAPHEIDETILLTAYKMDLTNPAGATITLGLERSSFLDNQASANKDAVNRIDQVINRVENQEVAVRSVQALYYLSTSRTETIGGSWTVDPPVWVEGCYYWQKIRTFFVNGTTSDSTPVCITGAKGEDGTDGISGKDGVGVSSITTQFYLSTSDKSLTGGSWVASMPEWSTGLFLWIRSVITYTDGSVAYTSPICDSSWTAIDDLEIGSRNYLQKTDVTKYLADWIPWNSALELTSDGFIKVTPNAGASSAGAYPPKLTNLKSGETYTVSFEAYGASNIGMNYLYIMSDDGNTSLAELINITTSPDRYSFTITPTKDYESCSILFGYTGAAGMPVFYLRNPKLEKGNKPTDWTPAPEDTTTELSAYRQETYTYVNESIENSEETTRTMLAEYAKTSDVEALREETATTFMQTAEDFTFKFDTVNERITTENGEIVRILEENAKYIRLVDGSIVLGEKGAILTTKYSNGRISFLHNDTVEVAYISDQKLYITQAEILVSLIIGSFGYFPRKNGNLSFKKI